MTTIDLSPLYRSSVGFDRLGSLLEQVQRVDNSTGYPPYNIEVTGENQYAIELAVAGFEESELDIQVERGVLTVCGSKDNGNDTERQYLHRGIAQRGFERRFNLADHVEVVDAKLVNGLLQISLVREIPEAMKPRRVAINGKMASIEAEVSDRDAA